MIDEYFEVIERKFLSGKITYERYIFLNDKLTQWYYESIEMEDE